MNSISSSLFWKFSERFGIQIVQFVLSIIIARLLTPAEYGIIAILMIFISIATIFVQSGLTSALIQKKDIRIADFSFVFFYSLLFALFLYAGLYCFAPYIATYFSLPDLVAIVRVASVVLFFGAFNSVQTAYASRNMLFRKQFICNFTAALVSGLVGVLFAYKGAGAWALVYQQLTLQICLAILLSVVVSWKPTFKFSITHDGTLIRFGGGLLGANLIDKLYHNLVGVIIGRKYSSTALALFEKGKQFPLILMDNIDGSIQAVMFPVYSKCQDNPKDLKQLLRRAISMSSYLSFSAMACLAAVGAPLIGFLLGGKWTESIPFLWSYCLISALFPLQTANLQAIVATGASRLYFKLILFKRLIGFSLLIVTAYYAENIFFVVLVCLVLEIIAILVNTIPNRIKFDYHPAELWHDIYPNVLVAVTVLVAVWPLMLLPLPNIAILGLQAIAMSIVFPSVSYFFGNPNFRYLLEVNREKLLGVQSKILSIIRYVR